MGNCTTVVKWPCSNYIIMLSPLLSLWPCKNSQIKKPLSCRLSSLPTISLYTSGVRILEERSSRARLLLSRWGSPAIDRWIGVEIGWWGEWKGMLHDSMPIRTTWHWGLETRSSLAVTVQWRMSRQLSEPGEPKDSVVWKRPQENSLWQGGRD